MQPDYRYELYDKNQNLIVDLTGLARSRKWSRVRNGVDEVSFEMDLRAFESMAREIQYSPGELLKTLSADIKVKRNTKYMVGAEIVATPITLNGDNVTINVKATGYLNLFKDRYITKAYAQVDRAAIARDMIDWSQKGGTANYITIRDFGVRPGPNQVANTVPSDRGMFRQNIKDELISSTELLTGRYDFEFTPFRLFNTYAQMGSVRDDVVIQYPGNIVSGTIEMNGTTIANEITGLGTGLGAEALSTTVIDDLSASERKVRQKIVTFNNVQLQSTVDEKTYAEVRVSKDSLTLPRLTINGLEFNLGIYEIGDIIPVKISGIDMLKDSFYYQRIEKMEVSLDENNDESIVLTLDSVSW
jgi:hypothetical protein